MQFLQPIWLWASAAVAIPIIIHFWNVKQGKTLKVGSIFLFTESARSGAKKRKLTELLLLLLRCLTLILLAMLLAEPAWLQHSNTKEKGWILIPKNELHEAYHAYQPIIDSLIEKRFVLHDFDDSFKQVDLQQALLAKSDSGNQSNLSYWTLLKQVDDSILPSLPVYVFIDNKLKHFTGVRPTLSTHINWYTFTGNDTASSWLEKAYQIAADSIRFVSGNSHSFGTKFTYQNLSTHDLSQPYMNVTKHLYSASQSHDAKQQENGIDTSSRTIVIYTKTLGTDAMYVEAAIKALQQFTQYNIKIVRSDEVKDIPNHFDWLFWLSTDTIPPFLLTKNVLFYEQGSPIQQTAALVMNDDALLTTTENLLVYQHVSNKNSSYQTIWQDDFGNPLLSLENNNRIYHFYSHFNPQWNDLVWSAQFSQEFYDLLFSEENNDEINDKRIIVTSQIQPAFIPGDTAMNRKNNPIKNDISNWFWLAAFILFIAERFLSFRTKKNLV